MTEPNKLPPDDRELEEFLARRSELSRRYREALPPPAAPPRLDVPVLNLARQELRRARRAPRLRWQQHFATAAAVVLVAGLAWMARQQVPPLRPVGSAAPAGAAGNAPVSSKAAPAPAMIAPALREQSSRQSLQVKPRSQQPGPEASQANTAGLPAPGAPPHPAPAAKAEPAMETAPAVPARAADPGEQSLSAAQPAPDGAAALAQARGRPDAAAEVATTAAPAQSLPSDAAAAPPAKVRKEEIPACGAPRRAPAQLQARPEFGLDSPAWLEQIRRLEAADPAAARAELACFVAARPQEAVPPDLQALLPAQP